MTKFTPPKRTLMGPGPSDVPQRILDAMAQPTIGHLDPAFQTLMEDIKGLLKYAFQTENALTFPLSAPGSAGMECAFVNLLEPGDKAIICRNGVFGGRMIENVERCGAIAVVVENDWGEPVDPEMVEDALKDHPDAKILAFVHAETSTGVLSDAETLCRLAREHDCLTIVDAVTSLGGNPLCVDDWGIDAIYSGSQKCLSCPPGLSPVSFSEHALEAIRNRSHKVQSWFLDLSLVMDYWDGEGGRTYHHTAPVNAMYGLHESLCILKEEGLENAWARHTAMHEKLRDGLEDMGLEYLVAPEYRLPQLNTVKIPVHVTDEAALRKRLLEEFNLEIGAGLGALAGKVWRIGLMGYSAKQENVDLCLNALRRILN
ncbi:alanine--glyoxylate aminotransferase family protein [Emcibacter sp.]|uniref:pyridoxal-phosphate-dependent aminotransferase family protein n=1 Tax=Emcibacter sp. TaxID=1979954 RepID=UPI002AA7116C|nr:alanine--glyoxylate aminotransferase family protein [Emcibacter sp.]